MLLDFDNTAHWSLKVWRYYHRVRKDATLFSTITLAFQGRFL